VAVKDKPLFTMKDFNAEIIREKAGNFDSEKVMGFLE
jgi:hypothetical protein